MIRAVYLLSKTILARGSNETAVEMRSSRPQVSVKRCRLACRNTVSVDFGQQTVSLTPFGDRR